MGEGIALHKSEYASIGTRFIALVIDGMIVTIPMVFAAHVIPFLGPPIVWLLYGPILECSTLKGTLGKYWMGIQTVDKAGGRVSFQTSLLRNLVKIFSSAVCCFGYLVAFFTEKKQALHDLAAETTVVKGESQQDIGKAWMESVRTNIGDKFDLGTGDNISKLERLQSLREKGAITDDEFQREKEKILRS